MDGLESFDTGLEWLREQLKTCREMVDERQDAEVGVHCYSRVLDYMMGVRSDIAKTINEAQEQMSIAKEALDTDKSTGETWSELCELMLDSLRTSIEAVDNSTMPEGTKFATVQSHIASWKKEIKKRSTGS